MAASCITATLVRGRTYSFNMIDPNRKGEVITPADQRFYVFERNTPKVVPEEVASELEGLVEIVKSDEDEIEKPLFMIDWDAPIRTADPTEKKVRMRLVSADVANEARRIKPKPRPKTGGPAGLLNRKFG